MHDVPLVTLWQRASDAAPGWAIWKNAEAALSGVGDTDSVAPRDEWKRVVDVFRSWATESGLDYVTLCRHVPNAVLVVASRRGDKSLLQFDIFDGPAFRGGTLVTARDMRTLFCEDSNGFRRVRPGAEGMFLLLFAGLRLGGRCSSSGFARRPIRQLLDRDWEGAEATAQLLGPLRHSALALAAAVVEGRWHRATALKLEARAAARALVHPDVLASRLFFRARARWPCDVCSALHADRQAPNDPEAWWARVARSHEMAIDGTKQ